MIDSGESNDPTKHGVKIFSCFPWYPSPVFLSPEAHLFSEIGALHSKVTTADGDHALKDSMIMIRNPTLVQLDKDSERRDGSNSAPQKVLGGGDEPSPARTTRVVRIVGCFPFAAISSVPALRAGSRRRPAAAENGQRQGLSAVRLGAVPFTGSVTTRGRAGQCSAETQTGAGNRGVPRVQGEEDEVQ